MLLVFLTWEIFESKGSLIDSLISATFFLNQNVLAWLELVCQQKVKTTKRQPWRQKSPRSKPINDEWGGLSLLFCLSYKNVCRVNSKINLNKKKGRRWSPWRTFGLECQQKDLLERPPRQFLIHRETSRW